MRPPEIADSHRAADLARPRPRQPRQGRVNDRDSDGLAALLHEDLRVRLLHTGEELDKDADVRLNREYPVEVWTAESVTRRTIDPRERPAGAMMLE
jgi:hypothetical protein